jgi:hypothetical protein
MRAAHLQIILKIEMLVGAWYVDEFGNQTREIKACDWLARESASRSKQKAPPLEAPKFGLVQ